HGGSILHRIGEDWALMTKGRPRLVGEKGAAKPAIDRSEMEPKLERLASGYTPIDGASLEDYMAEAGFKTSSRFHDTYGWDILVNGSGHTSTMVAWSHTGSISGNAYDYRKNEYFRQESKARRDLMENHLKDMTAKNKANLAENPRFFAAPIHTNALGWPALTDAESVRVSRDGLEGLEIERQAGSRVEATFDNPDHRYKHFRITDAHTGKSLHTSGLPSRGGWPWTPEFETDAIVVEVGYDVSGEFEPRGGSVVTSNPGESSVNLKLWMNTP
ncbi:MAG TPA: hypothetical protein VKA36_03590, partial [Solirubrobacterales bacterium]|nr:hypothetical protein [Solirubrobacterales bacterium]